MFTKRDFLELVGLEDLTDEQYDSMGSQLDIILMGLSRRVGRVADALEEISRLMKAEARKTQRRRPPPQHHPV